MDIQEVEREIRKIEADRTTWGNCEKLAILYTVRDHNDQTAPVEMYSFAAPVISGESEFLQAVGDSSDLQQVLNVIDEHFEAIKLVYPKEYDAVIRRIKEIR